MKLLKAEAGVNDGKAGLLSAAGLFAKGGIFDKKSESFNIQELDPYLLFDSRSSMLGTLENPTLDLDPATPSTLDVITATRAGVATYTDPDGNIATASADTVRVDYTQGAELTPTKFQHIGYTDFSQGWTLQAGITLNSNTTETLSPEGKNNAAKVVSTDNTKGFFFGGLSLTVAAIRTIFLKGEAGGETITFKDPSGHGTPIVHTLTTEWVRYEMSTTNDGNNYQGLFIDNISVGTIYIYGPQLEEGTTASSFVENTTGSPKFTGISATYAPRVPMVLIEPSATNLVDYSEDIASNLWGKTGVSVTENAATAPDGTVIASKIQVDSSNSFHFVGKSIPLGAAYYSFSAYLKADTAITASFFFSQSGNNGAVFDLQAGSLISVSGTGNTASIEDVGNGWFRCVVTNNGSSDVADQVRIGVANGAISSFQGNETDSLYLWGVQVETGSVATSYIPTSGGDAAARTRAADDLEITGSDFTDFFNDTEGTVYVEAASRKVNVYPRVFKINGVLGSEYFEVALNSTTVRCRYDNATNQVDLYSGDVSDNTFNKIAVSYRVNDFLLSVDGGASLPDTNASLFSATSIRIGNSGSSTRLNGHIKRLIYWPTHSSRL